MNRVSLASGHMFLYFILLNFVIVILSGFLSIINNCFLSNVVVVWSSAISITGLGKKKALSSSL